MWPVRPRCSKPAVVAATLVLLCSLCACQVGTIKRESKQPLGIEFLADDLRPEVLGTHLNEFTVIFTGVVEQAADEIAAQATDPVAQSNALRWKIQAVPEAQLAGLRTYPVASLLDLWTFSVQMHLFFAVGEGRDLFGEQQDIAVQASLRLRRDMSKVARTAIDPDEFEPTEQMIVEWAERNPLRDLRFARESIVPDFADSSRRSEDVFGSMGTIEDVAVAGKASLAILAASLPRQARWQAELILHEGLHNEEVDALLVTAADASELMREVPALVEDSVATLQETVRVERDATLVEVEALMLRIIDRALLMLAALMLAGLVLLALVLRFGRNSARPGA